MNAFVRVSCLAGLAALLAACQAVSPVQPPALQQPQPQRPAIEGDWVDPNGIVSSFRSGRFETRTTDTNTLLADGSYRLVSDRLVEISMTSRVRGTSSTVNCAMVGPTQLNCTSDSGSQFSLARRGMG